MTTSIKGTHGIEDWDSRAAYLTCNGEPIEYVCYGNTITCKCGERVTVDMDIKIIVEELCD